MTDKDLDRAMIERVSMDSKPAHLHVDEESQTIDLDAEKKLLRRLDWNLIPVLWVLFLCAFIDRINIGNARLQGLEADLNMTGSDYNVALFTFFILYILLEVPCNMVLKKVRPSVFLCSIMGAWGVITVFQGITRSFAGLVVCRVLLGAFEAGFFPGAVYLLSMFYKRHELQWRFNLFFSASIFAGAASGFLAYAIAHMDGVAGYSGWRWIFILEGIATVFIAIVAYFRVPDWPDNAKFLQPEQRELLRRRLALDQKDATMDHWNRKTAQRVFADVKIYLGILMYIGIVTTSYSTSFFVPTILRQLGWTALRAQVMSIPIWLTAAVMSLAHAWLSDWVRHRFAFVICGCLWATVGYVILLNMFTVAVGVRYFGVFTLVIGCAVAQPAAVVWVNNTMAGHYKKGISSAMMIGFGNISGIIASNIYITSQAPEFPLGYGMGLGLTWLCVISAVIFVIYLRRENKMREQGKRDHRLNLPDDEKMNLGDDHPSFRFTY